MTDMEQSELWRSKAKSNVCYVLMAFFAGSTIFLLYTVSVLNTRLVAVREGIESRQQTIEIQQMQSYSLHTLLTKEQETAGVFESGQAHWKEEATKWEHRARSAWGEKGRLSKQINRQQEHICALEQLLRDNGVRLYRNKECH